MTHEGNETRTAIFGSDGVWLEDVGVPPWMVWRTTATDGNKHLADGEPQMQTTDRGKRYNWQWVLGVALVLFLAAAVGRLTAHAGLALTLRGVGAVMAPVLVMVGITKASQQRIGWLVMALALVLWALAAWGVWALLT